MVRGQLTDTMMNAVDADDNQIGILNGPFDLAAGDVFFHWGIQTVEDAMMLGNDGFKILYAVTGPSYH